MPAPPPGPAGRGRAAENLALAFLQARGLRLEARNFRSRTGEIDLVMRHAEMLVFVEVRMRRAGSLLSGAESVDSRKQARILATARRYLALHPERADDPCRFDVVTVGEQDTLAWIENAFGA